MSLIMIGKLSIGDFERDFTKPYRGQSVFVLRDGGTAIYLFIHKGFASDTLREYLSGPNADRQTGALVRMRIMGGCDRTPYGELYDYQIFERKGN